MENRTSIDPLDRCSWPDLPPRYAAALRDAARFVLERFDPWAIIAGGSVVRGAGDPTSDIDLYVIHELPYRQRLQRWFGDVPCEIFANPVRSIREYFETEHRRGRPSTAHIIATGFPVLGGPELDGLRAEASAWLNKPSMLTSEEDTWARYAAATCLEDGEDVAERDPAMASALLGEAVLAMLRYHVRAHEGRLPGAKHLLIAVERCDREAAEIARRF
jgi:hypothetical protein